MSLGSCVWISISVKGRMAGVLCSSTLSLSDKTMTQYDEKQRQLSAIVRTEKMTQLSIQSCFVCARVGVFLCMCVSRTPLGANGFKQHKRLINTSIFSLGGLTTKTFYAHTHNNTQPFTHSGTPTHTNTHMLQAPLYVTPS